MIHSLNRIELIGRLGADPQIFYPKADLALCTCWLVTGDLWRDTTGILYEAVEWHRVILWERLAKDCNSYCVRGDLLYLEGHLTTRSWHDSTQQRHVATEIVADRFLLLHRDPESPRQRDAIFIPDTPTWANEPYEPPTEPDLLTQGKLFWGGPPSS
jgi:single-strand DNA-binding protein